MGLQWFLTSDLIQALLCDMVVLVDPLAIALEIDLGGRVGSTDKLHRLVLDNVCILWLQQEMGEGLCRG